MVGHPNQPKLQAQAMNIDQVITELDIQALIDNELSTERAKIVSSYLQVDRDAHHYYMQILIQKNLMRLYWASKTNH